MKCKCRECTVDRPECKRLVTRFLKESEGLPICTPNFRFTIDRMLASFLMANGGERFLVTDVTEGPQVGGMSENVMCELSGSTIKGKSGRFTVRETYGPMSVRSFELWST